jgi:hypothetical protein
MSQFKNKLMNDSGLKESDFKCYTADTSDKMKKELHDANKAWKDIKCVITNQSITVGVSYDRHDFDSIFIFYDTFVKPRDIIQTSYRLRKIYSNKLYLVQIGKGSKTNDFKKADIDDPVYNRLIDNLIIEEKSKGMKTLRMFFKKAGYLFDDLVVIDKFDKEQVQELNKFEEDIWKVNCIYDYDSIPNPEDMDSHIGAVKELDATTMDKLIYLKFKFKCLFKEETPEEIIKGLWTNRNRVINYYEFLKTNDNIIKQILKELKLEKVDFSESKLQISDELRDKIFDQFIFTRISRDCSAKKLLSKALNTFFMMNKANEMAYGWVKKDEKHGEWMHSEEFCKLRDECNEWLGIDHQGHLILNTKKCLFNQGSLFIDDPTDDEEILE